MGFYAYGIDKVEMEKGSNNTIVNIYYGDGKECLRILKEDMKKFFKAIISPEEIKARGLERHIEAECELSDIFYHNLYLKGRAMILITDFDNYNEYGNFIQNSIKNIAGLGIKGKVDMLNSFDYEYATDKLNTFIEESDIGDVT